MDKHGMQTMCQIVAPNMHKHAHTQTRTHTCTHPHKCTQMHTHTSESCSFRMQLQASLSKVDNVIVEPTHAHTHKHNQPTKQTNRLTNPTQTQMPRASAAHTCARKPTFLIAPEIVSNCRTKCVVKGLCESKRIDQTRTHTNTMFDNAH